MSQQIDFFKLESKKLVKQYKSQESNAINRVQKYIKNMDDFCLARAQHVIAREAGFVRWEELVRASADRLHFGVILYKNPYLTMIEGWSCPDDAVNPYRESDRRDVFLNYDWVMRIVSWLRENNICPPDDVDDIDYFHTGPGKDCFSRLFVHLYNEPYKYTGTGLVIVAFMMLGLKPLNWDDYDRLPEDGQGRCCFAISKRAWEAACRKYPMLK